MGFGHRENKNLLPWTKCEDGITDAETSADWNRIISYEANYFRCAISNNFTDCFKWFDTYVIADRVWLNVYGDTLLSLSCFIQEHECKTWAKRKKEKKNEYQLS